MIASWPDGAHPEFESFREAIGGLTGLRFVSLGSLIIVDGTVPSYEAKALIDAEAMRCGLPIENRVRVAPGVYFGADGPLPPVRT